MLQHAGKIAVGHLGVASVVRLDFRGATKGGRQLHDATVDAFDTDNKVVSGAQSLFESGQGLLESAKDGIFPCGKQLWYAALRRLKNTFVTVVLRTLTA